jgi:hypothetical protein
VERAEHGTYSVAFPVADVVSREVFSIPGFSKFAEVEAWPIGETCLCGRALISRSIY